MILKLIAFFLIMAVLPVWLGFLYTEPKKPGTAYLCGFLTMLSIYEFLAVPAAFLKLSLHLVSAVWLGLMALLAVATAILRRRAIFGRDGVIRSVRLVRPLPGRTYWLFLLAALLIAVQAVAVGAMQHIDNDDAFYVAQSVTNVETDSVLRFSPYTGEAYSAMPARYVLAAWPSFISTLSQLTGFHPTILAHTLLPPLLILLGYLVFALIGSRLVKGDKEKLGAFLLLVCAMTAFGCFTRRNAANLFFVRIWQGKAILAGILLPACFFVSWLAMKEKGGVKEWLLVFELVTTACLMTSISVALVPCVLGCTALTYAVARRKVGYLVKTALCCIPAVVCGGVYLLIK